MLRPRTIRSVATLRNLRDLALILWPLIAMISLGVIATKHPNKALISITISAAALLPLVMIVAARYGSAARLPWRTGFAICCGGYFLFFIFLADNPFLENLFTTKAINLCCQRLFPDAQNYSGGFGGGFGGGGGGFGAFDVASPESTGNTSSEVGNNVPADPFGGPVATNSKKAPAQPSVSTTSSNTAKVLQAQDWQQQQEWASNFVLIGHGLWALLFGWIGGCLAQYLARRQAKASVANKPPVAPTPANSLV